MLIRSMPAECRRFRAAFRPGGETDPHRARCAGCDRHARALETAAVPVPLPAALRARLLAVAMPLEALPVAPPADPLPRPLVPLPFPATPLAPVPLPAELRARLLALPRREPGPLPRWLRGGIPWAASFWAALVVAFAAGGPGQVVPRLTAVARTVALGAEAGGDRLEIWRERAATDFETARAQVEERLEERLDRWEAGARALWDRAPWPPPAVATGREDSGGEER